MNFHFIASDNFTLNDFKDIKKFIESFPDFQSFVLNNEQEPKLLLKLIGIENFDFYELKSSHFVKYWDISKFYLPEFKDYDFNLFYDKWIEISGRENNMDEFGNFIFLQEMGSKLNKMTCRLIVKEV